MSKAITKTKRKIGRPKGTWVRYSPKHRKVLLAGLKKYLAETEYPQLAEFCYRSDVDRAMIYQWDEFINTRKKLREKQQASLVHNTLAGKFNPAMAIFCLKNNHGWRDTQEIEHKGTVALTIRPASEDDGDNGKLLEHK
ncbi:hypothetical protein KA005_09980 [bacterium]|nr:hypothetical protein [bacterium]